MQPVERTTSPVAIPLHPRMRLVWILRFGLLFALPWLPVLFLLTAKLRMMSFAYVPLLAALFGLLLGWRYALRYAALYSAANLADGVLIRRGVWWRAEVFVPRARIQHTEINQGPLDRRWGMASLSIHTAGTRLENITVPGVPRDIAVVLRDTLLDRKAHVDGA
jgi:uncharacterized protein